MSRQRTGLRPFNKKNSNSRVSASESHTTDSGIRGHGIEVHQSLSFEKDRDTSLLLNTKSKDDNKATPDKAYDSYVSYEFTLKKEIEKWKQKFNASQKTVNELNMQLKDLDVTVGSLEETIKSLKSQDLKYQNERKDLEAELKCHDNCQKVNDSLKEILDKNESQIKILQNELSFSKSEMQTELRKLTVVHGKDVELLEKEHEEEKNRMGEELKTKTCDLINQHQTELDEKNEKLNILKNQVAEALKGSSIERQHQIEELLRELKRVSDEADGFKAALNHMKLSNKEQCHNCAIYEQKCDVLEEQIKSKEMTIKDLFTIGAKMESQLSKQDDLLQLWSRVQDKEKANRR